MREVPVGRSRKALVDDKDYDLVSQHRWVYHPHGPRTSDFSEFKVVNGKDLRTYVYMHRLILGLTDPDIQVRFLNTNVLDCQRKNMLVWRLSHVIRNKRAEYTIMRSPSRNKLQLVAIEDKCQPSTR